MKQLSKKIIALIYLSTILFSLFIPFNQTFAQNPESPLSIDTNSSSIKTGETTKINAYLEKTATIKKFTGGETISFFALDGGTFDSATCKMPVSSLPFCSVIFIPPSPATKGLYKIKASMAIGEQIFISNIIAITVPKTEFVNLPPDNNNQSTNTDTTYDPLAKLPGLESPIDTAGECPFGRYLNIMIKLILGIAAVLAMVMIVMGGIEYMTSELISGKEAGKETVTHAILGLLIALGAYLILNTINPQLLSVCLDKLPEATIVIQPLYDRGYNDPKQANGESVRCTPVLSGPCSVANLTPVFGDKAVAMSKICNMESSGTNATSGTDVCKPGNNPFSFGLFQVNLAANGSLAGADCVGLFDRAVSSKDAIEPKYTSGFTCSLLSGKETLYNTCKTRLLNTNNNLAIAKSLFSNSKGINNWVGDKKFCASAFK